ncbi:MAG: tandem-95 repeat protein [Rubripirellula sp.]
MRSNKTRLQSSAPSRRTVRQLLGKLLLGDSSPTEAKRGRLLLESLEQRQMLAGDIDLFATDGNAAEQPSQAAETGGLQVEGQAEGEAMPDLVQFAQALTDAGVEFFGAGWCPACTQQKELFEDGKDDLPFIEVTNSDRSLNSIGIAENIQSFPTWKFPNGTVLEGVQSLETLSQTSGVAIPQSEQPTFEPIGNTTVQIGSPLHIPIDAYDPDGGPLTVTVSVADPTLLEATVLTGNRSIRIDMETYGDMVFELFEQRAPRASGRVADLADTGFYDGIIFHRVTESFVIQGGDPTGTGTSGSSLGQFDDDFHPELQHNREGVLSFAKSSDDTNNSQFFVTEIPTRFLDFNHSIFGQLVEGFDVREDISRASTPESRGVSSSQVPDVDVVIESIDVFDDTENSVVMLKPTGTATGTTTVTFLVTDQDGNTHSETVTVAVVADTANSQPFLEDIPTPATTPINSNAQLQLVGVDVENDAMTFFAQAIGSGAAASVNPTTGLVTVTPETGFTGSVNVQVGVRPGSGVTGNSASDQDTQTVTFTFEGESTALAPTSIDLQAGSDTGSSNIDNITNAGSLSFLVEGVTSGSVVELVNVLDNNTVVGTATATGTTVVVTTSNIAALGDGNYTLAARQTSGSETSTLSPSLSLTYDATSPASVIGSANTLANVGRAYQTDLISSEEGSGLVYAGTLPTGATINSTTGVIDWTPASDQQGTNAFTIDVTDLAGNTRSESFNVDVADVPIAEIALTLTDLQGTPISSIEVGQTFLLNMTAVDARLFTQPGVFAAYADILFDSNLIRPVPGATIDYSDNFTIVPKGSFSTGLIDELGAVSNQLAASNVRESLIATVRMEALASGTVNIRSEAADESDSDFLLFALDDPIPANQIAFGSVALAVGQSFTVGADTFTVAEDSAATTLDVLANDVVVSGSQTLSVVSVTQPTSGGTVVLSGGVVSFTPDADFNGDAVFTYRVSDTNGIQETGSVTVTVTAVNDLPTGVDDTFNVDQNSADNTLDVLTNDSIAPDSGETLNVIDVSTPSAGGTVTISSDGQSVVYTPATDFTGTDSFTYTLSDGALTDLVQVSVTVAPSDDPPTAVDDAFTVTEDAAEASFDVVANDTQDADGQSFVISSVGTPTQGGSARVSADGTQFFYAPAADFAGSEQVTYTIRDTGGGLAVATVTFTVTAVNDAPPDASPTVNFNRGAAESVALSLTDLPDNVDANETLVLSVTSAATTAGGSVRVDNDSILYTPPSATFTGTDSFSYTVGDGSGLTSNGTVSVNVNDFTSRDIFLTVPSQSSGGQVNGIMLKGTNLLGETVEVPLTYGTDNAVFDDVLPGDYVIEIPAVPFLQNASAIREIPVTSAADDGDAVVESGIGRLRPEFLSIRDWLGSSSSKTLLVAVAPGESSTATQQTPSTDTIENPVVELDATGSNVVIRGTAQRVPAGSDGNATAVTTNVEATLATNDSRVQLRGEQDGMRLFRIDVEREDTFVESTTSAASGEQVVVEGSTAAVTAPAAVQVASNTLTLGDIQAEGESIAAAATTLADLFVPVTDNGDSRTDVAVLATEEGEVWAAQSLASSVQEKLVAAAESVDSAMQSVTSDLSLHSLAGDEIAANSSDNRIDELAVDAALESEL